MGGMLAVKHLPNKGIYLDYPAFRWCGSECQRDPSTLGRIRPHLELHRPLNISRFATRRLSCRLRTQVQTPSSTDVLIMADTPAFTLSAPRPERTQIRQTAVFRIIGG